MSADRGGRQGLVVRLTLAASRVLVLAYPGWFRRRYAESVLQNTRDLVDRRLRAGGALAVAALWPRLVRDLLVGGLTERARPDRVPSPDRPAMLDTLLQDLRFARRSMLARPGLTALAVLTLALGIGASASMFSVVDAVMLEPLPYPDSEQLTSVYTTIPEFREDPVLGRIWDRGKWSYDEFVEWRQRETSFVEAAPIEDAGANLTGLGAASRVGVGLAGLELFPMLGAVPVRGRLFGQSDLDTQAAVAVLDYGFWQERFGGDESAVGQSIFLDERPYTVIGILPDGFRVEPFTAQVWLPIFENRPFGYFPGNFGDMDHVLRVIGRLRPGVTPDAAAEETGRLLAAIGGPDHFTRHGAHVVPRLLDRTRNVRYPLLLLMAAVLMLLLVACANVATFLLGQAVDREQEIAVRGALGAGGLRIARQLLTESLLLAALGGAGGLLLAALGVRALAALAPSDLPRLDRVALDPSAIGFAIVMAALSGLLFGLAPALSLARPDLGGQLRSARSGAPGRSRLQAGMVIAEVTVATVLLVGAGLLVRSFTRLNAVDPGFRADGVLWVRVSPNRSAFTDAEGQIQQAMVASYMSGLEEALGAVPGVVETARAEIVPFAGSSASNNVTPEGYEGEQGWMTISQRRFVSSGYHRLLGIPLVAGRLLDDPDDRPDAASVVLVSESLARRFFPAGDAVGKKLAWWGQESEIVGVVGDIRDRDLAEEPEMMFYAPPSLFDFNVWSILLRVDGDEAAVTPSVREALANFDPELPIQRISPLSALLSDSLSQARYRTRLIVVFAMLAASLSVLGLYGVTARAVAGRTREIGIRVALGAEGSRVVSLVLRDGLRLATLGGALGLAVSVVATRLLSEFLYGVGANDPLTLAAIVLLVIGMATGASLVPSLRASRVDPVTALRVE